MSNLNRNMKAYEGFFGQFYSFHPLKLTFSNNIIYPSSPKNKFSRYLFTPMLMECLERHSKTVFQRSTTQLK